MSFSEVWLGVMGPSLEFWDTPMQIYEWNFSLWDVFLLTTVASIYIAFMIGAFYDD